MKKYRLIAVLLVVAFSARVQAQNNNQIRLATYNVEYFKGHFASHKLTAEKPAWLDTKSPEAKDLLNDLRKLNDKSNWATAQVIEDPEVNPDIICIEECCGQSDLEYFNKRWLRDAYATVIVFPGNSDREQNVAMMLKPGFKVVEKKDQYYLEKDSGKNARSDRLFARGPAFVLVETPSKYRFWVGVTHGKSKSGNSVEVTEWRNREAKRTHEIIKELSKTGPEDVILLGDFNDEFGIQEFEDKGGGDAIANVVGPAEDGLILATKPLIDAKAISYGGYWDPKFRSFIDQVVITSSMKDQVQDIHVFDKGLAKISSDHFPVVITVKPD